MVFLRKFLSQKTDLQRQYKFRLRERKRFFCLISLPIVPRLSERSTRCMKLANTGSIQWMKVMARICKILV